MRILWSLLLVAWLGLAQAQAGLFDVVRFGSLQEVRAQVGAALKPTSVVDSYGQDLLVYAANNTGDPEVIRYLVGIGFNVNMATPERWTPLMYAVRFNPVCEIALVLLELGANPVVVNSAGETARVLAGDGPNPACMTSRMLTLLGPVQQAAPVAPPVAPAQPRAPIETRSCCRYCSTGQACGDSCISRSNTCRRGAGCACNAVVPEDEIMLVVRAGVQRLDLMQVAINVGCPAESVAMRLRSHLVEV